MTKHLIKTIQNRIADIQTQHDAAKARGETDAYLAILRVKLDELRAVLKVESYKENQNG